MSVDISQFVAAFLEESYEGLDIMESSLLNLDSSDVETINSIFRAAHSIKGGAGTFGLDEVANFTHIVETILDALRSDAMEFSPEIVNLLLESVDCIRALLAASQGGEQVDADQIEAVHTRLKAAMGQENTSDTTQTPPSEPFGEQLWEIQFIPNADLIVQGHRPEAMFSALSDLGTIEANLLTSQVPPLEQLDPERCYLSWALHLRSEHTREEIAEIFEWVEDDCDLSITPVVEETAQSSSPTDYSISFKPDPELLQTGNDPYFIFDALNQLGALQTQIDTSALPKLTDLDPEKLYLKWQLDLQCSAAESEIKELFEWVETHAELGISAKNEAPSSSNSSGAIQAGSTLTTPSASSPSSPSKTEGKSATEAKRAKPANVEASSIRVETNKIDALINRVGELVITQAMLSQVGSELAEDERVGALAERLQEGLSQLERNTRDLQQDVMRVRMLPNSFIDLRLFAAHFELNLFAQLAADVMY